MHRQTPLKPEWKTFTVRLPEILGDAFLAYAHKLKADGTPFFASINEAFAAIVRAGLDTDSDCRTCRDREIADGVRSIISKAIEN
jgi:hypothetical protein